MTDWTPVETAVKNAAAITWDGCHKIYMAMDDGQVVQFVSYGYDVIPVNDNPDDDDDVSINSTEALEMLRDWYASSCGLRFIEAVSTKDGDMDFQSLIPQFSGD